MKRRALWIVVLACAAWSSAGPTAAPQPPVGAAAGSPAAGSPAAGSLDAVAAIRAPEVKLRKLYLVRPDLMAFPVPYDVVC